MRNKPTLPRRAVRVGTLHAKRMKGRTYVPVGDKVIALSHPRMPVVDFAGYCQLLRDNENKLNHASA